MAKKHKGHYCKICGEYKSNESIIKKLINYKDENQQELLAHVAHGRLGYDE